MIGRERTRQRGKLRMAASMPFIYGMVIPVGLLDISVQIYEHICFPLYGITHVKRSDFVRCRGRGRNMLRIIDRFHCWYCAYVNGAIHYIQTVAAETEKYWCPIRHIPLKGFKEPPHHKSFAPDGDPVALQKAVKSYTYKA